MRRRTLLKHFGLGLAGCGIGGGAFITNSDKKPGKKPMKKNSILQHPLCPPRLSIDELGWIEFLEIWDREGFAFSKEEVLRYGIEGGGHPENTDQKNHHLKYKIKLSARFHYDFPDEIFFGGVAFPPSNLEEKRIADKAFGEIVKALRILIENNAVVRPQAHVLVNGTHLFPPASENQIRSVQARFGVELPDSYKNFLRVSNGCFLGLYWTLVPIDQIETFFVDGDMRDYIEEGPEEVSDEIYYGYDELGLVYEPFPYYRPEKFLKALLLSDPHDIDDCLNMVIYPPLPGAPTDDPEWEVFSHCGIRARSFKHMMEYRYLHNILLWRKEAEEWE